MSKRQYEKIVGGACRMLTLVEAIERAKRSRSPVTLLCVAAAPWFSTIAYAGSARDYLNAPVDSWFTTYDASYWRPFRPKTALTYRPVLVQTSSDSQSSSHGQWIFGAAPVVSQLFCPTSSRR
jgi:hypothetical protein